MQTRRLVRKIRKQNSILARFLSKDSKSIKESTTALLITIIATSFAGLFLSNYREFLLLLPGLIILVPGAVNMRGTIFGAMGARMGSAFHLGLLKGISWKNPVVKTNAKSTLLLSIYLPIILAVLAKFISGLFGIASISIFDFIGIAVLGSLISAAAMIVLSFGIYEAAYLRGWDPDNVTAPLITSFGDLTTIPSLLAAAFFIFKLKPYTNIFAYGIGFLAIALFLLTAHSKQEYRKIVMQSLAILTFAALVESCSGIMLHGHLEKLALVPITLILLPAFLGQGGNIGSIFASKLTTELHLGLIEADYKIGKKAKEGLLNSYLFCAIIFPAVAVCAYILAAVTNMGLINLASLVIASLAAGLLLTTVISFTTFALAVFFYKRAIDPDNFLIPIITSTADFLGILCLIFVLSLIGVL